MQELAGVREVEEVGLAGVLEELDLAGVLEVLRLAGVREVEEVGLAGVREVEEVGLAGVREVQELAELLRALQEPSVVQPSAAERQYYRPGRRSM